MEKKIMNNKVCYGEYSLEYWIKLLLSQNVVLPPYQRYFVWGEEEIKTFVTSLKELSFAPSVIIGSFWNQAEKKQINYIIDGQQRLTSILLAAMGIIPNPKKFKTEETEDIEDEAYKRRISKKKMVWTINKLLKKQYQSINEIEFDRTSYNSLPSLLTMKELKTLRLGYAYIIPQLPDHKNDTKQQECFSKLFRNINFQGVALDKVESRRSLYFLNAKFADWFDPKFLRDRGVDFVRFTSLLTNYHKIKSTGQEPDWGNIIPANRRSKDYEKYYEKYIYSITEAKSDYSLDELESIFGRFTDVFPNSRYEIFLKKAETILNQLELGESVFDDTIKMDLYLFGLFHFVLFEKKNLDFSNVGDKERLKESIEQAYNSFKKIDNHSKSPNTKTYIKNRIEKSLSIYEDFLPTK